MAPRYTQEEDDAIMRIFSTYHCNEERVRELRECVRTRSLTPEPRPFSSYRNRYYALFTRQHGPPSSILPRSTSVSSTISTDSPPYAPSSPAYTPLSPTANGNIVGVFGSVQETIENQSKL